MRNGHHFFPTRLFKAEEETLYETWPEALGFNLLEGNLKPVTNLQSAWATEQEPGEQIRTASGNHLYYGL